MEKVRELIRLHPSISQPEIATKLGLDLGTVRTIVNDALHLGQMNRRWTPTTLTSTQRAQRLDWATFVLEKSKHANRFVARFDSWIYKRTDFWTFDATEDTFVERRAIACFYSVAGVHAIASMSDPRLLSSPEIVDNCLGDEVKGEKRFLYVDGETYNSARLLECLHDRGVVLVALPECSPDLTLGESFLEPTFWSNLQRRRFATHDAALKEYKNCIGKVMGHMGSKMFERWFERMSRCVQRRGDYVEQINFSVDLTDYNAPWRFAVEPDAVVPSQVPAHTPIPSTTGVQESVATTDHCVEWQLKEPKLEPKEECHYDENESASPDYSEFIDNQKLQIKLAIASDGGYRLVTGPLMLASTIGTMEAQRMVPQQCFQVDDLRNSGSNVTQQQHLAPASPEDSADDLQNSENDGNVRTQSDMHQQQLTVATEAASNEKSYPKPAYSYTCLCALAMKNSRLGALPVTAIYRFICEHFPYFKTAPNGWKNSVRHNLSHNKCFAKIDTTTASQPNKRRNLWLIDPTKVDKMEAELRNKSRKHSQEIKESMSHPENLDLLVRGEMKFHGDFSEDTEDSSDEIEVHNELVFASQLEASSASDSYDGCSSQDDDAHEIDVDDDDKEALRLQLEMTCEGDEYNVPIPVAKRQKTLAGTVQAVYVYQPGKSRKTSLAYLDDPLLKVK